MAKRTTWTLVAERDKESGAWVGEIAEEPTAHTHGRSLQQLKNRMAEALEVTLGRDLTENDVLVLEIRSLPKGLRDKMVRAVELEDAERERRKLLRSIASGLKNRGLSMRDTAEVLNVSHSRVQQLLNG